MSDSSSGEQSDVVIEVENSRSINLIARLAIGAVLGIVIGLLVTTFFDISNAILFLVVVALVFCLTEVFRSFS